MDDHRTFRVQFTLRALLALILVIACSLGAGIWFGVQAALAVVALGLTSYAVIHGGPRAIASPNGPTWFSALLMLFSGFYVSEYGPWADEYRMYGSPTPTTTFSIPWEPWLVALIWLFFSIIAFGVLVGTMALAQITFFAPWRWRRFATFLFLAINVATSAFLSIEFWRMFNEISPLVVFVLTVSVLAAVLTFVPTKLHLAEPRRVALAETLAVVSVLPMHPPFDFFFRRANSIPGTYGAGAWMLIAGSLGLIAANIWLWFKHTSEIARAIES